MKRKSLDGTRSDPATPARPTEPASGAKRRQTMLSSFFAAKTTAKPTAEADDSSATPPPSSPGTSQPSPAAPAQASAPALTLAAPAGRAALRAMAWTGPRDAQLVDPNPTPNPTPTPTVPALAGRLEQMQRRGARGAAADSLPDPTTTGPGKLTPLEQQVVALKEKHPDTVLLFEVGYKFRFFGNDARIAARVLGICAFTSHSMVTASIPTHRLGVHVKRLVHMGHRVGIVRQRETAALKNASDNRNAPFVRELDQIYTKGTAVDDLALDGDDTGSGGPDDAVLLAVHETDADRKGAQIAVAALLVNSGELLWDCFGDDAARTRLEASLAHTRPGELLLPPNGALSVSTEATLDAYALERIRESPVRVERRLLVASGRAPPPFAKELPRNVQTCILALCDYLESLGLERAVSGDAASTITVSRLERTASSMLLHPHTIEQLEIFRNSRDGSRRGTLVALLDRTRTRMGRRLFQRWLQRPLCNLKVLEERREAVRVLADAQNSKTAAWRALDGALAQLPDLPARVTKIRLQKTTPNELCGTIEAFIKFLTRAPVAANEWAHVPLLCHLLTLPAVLPSLESTLRLFDRQAVRCGNMRDMLQPPDDKDPHWNALLTQRQAVRDAEAALQVELGAIRIALNDPRAEFVTVAGIDHLVEVPPSRLGRIPADWLKMSVTKAKIRFHSADSVPLLKARDRACESLVLAAMDAFNGILDDLAALAEPLRQVAHAAATLDCLVSLAQTAALPGHVQAELVDGPPILEVKDACHPVLLDAQVSGGLVPNSVALSSGDSGVLPSCMILTGPNMGGKSTLLRTVASVVLLNQIGGFVPAQKARLGIFDGIHTRLGASDNLMRGESTFMKELLETSDMLRHATSRSLVIFDELGRGTSTFDGYAIAHATLHHLVTSVRAVTLFVTHFAALCALPHQFPGRVTNAHMAFRLERRPDTPVTSDDDKDNLWPVFLYRLCSGPAQRSYGIHVARMAGLPSSITSLAQLKALELERAHDMRTAALFASLFKQGLQVCRD